MSQTDTVRSSIVPEGSALQNVRDNQLTVSSMSLEIFHILCFFVIAYFIFGKDLISKKSKKEKVVTQEQPSELISEVNSEAEIFYKKAQ